jgi:hypothetical protein
MVRGRLGRFFLLKLLPVKARVLAVDHPDGRANLVNRADLSDIREPANSLFVAAAEPGPSPLTQPLPYGVLDLDPVVVTDRGPPLRVKCYVRDCQRMLRPPSRGFRGDVCREHGIRCHLSGSSPTYSYARAERNIIASPRLFTTKLRGNKFKYETHRFGYERSEDCLTWNVFRSFQEAGCLHEILRFVTGIDIREEPELFLWGLRMTDDSLEPWPLLLRARERFESSLPVRRPGTEPDISIVSRGRALLLIEAKFCSPNTCYVAGPRKDAQSLTLAELIGIYQDPTLRILDVDRAKAADRVHYQLWRNMIFSEFMAGLDCPTTQAYHVNLVRAGYEHESTSEFRQLIRPEFADRFARITWEQLFVLAHLHWRKLTLLIEYMLTKTASLSPAFQLDAW